MKSILILGATGYIGRNLTIKLLKSFNVIAIKFGSNKIDENITKHKKFVCYKYKNSYTDLKIFIKKYKPFLMINCAGNNKVIVMIMQHMVMAMTMARAITMTMTGILVMKGITTMISCEQK